MKSTPWFAIRRFDDGESLVVVHWKGPVVIAAALVLGGAGLLGSWLLLGRNGVAMAIDLALLSAPLAALYVTIRRRIIDERR